MSLTQKPHCLPFQISSPTNGLEKDPPHVWRQSVPSPTWSCGEWDTLPLSALALGWDSKHPVLLWSFMSQVQEPFLTLAQRGLQENNKVQYTSWT